MERDCKPSRLWGFPDHAKCQVSMLCGAMWGQIVLGCIKWGWFLVQQKSEAGWENFLKQGVLLVPSFVSQLVQRDPNFWLQSLFATTMTKFLYVVLKCLMKCVSGSENCGSDPAAFWQLSGCSSLWFVALVWGKYLQKFLCQARSTLGESWLSFVQTQLCSPQPLLPMQTHTYPC